MTGCIVVGLYQSVLRHKVGFIQSHKCKNGRSYIAKYPIGYGFEVMVNKN